MAWSCELMAAVAVAMSAVCWSSPACAPSSLGGGESTCEAPRHMGGRTKPGGWLAGCAAGHVGQVGLTLAKLDTTLVAPPTALGLRERTGRGARQEHAYVGCSESLHVDEASDNAAESGGPVDPNTM